MMDKITRCCKDCTSRHLHCHSECTKYLEARRERDEFNKNVSDSKNIDYLAHNNMRRGG